MEHEETVVSTHAKVEGVVVSESGQAQQNEAQNNSETEEYMKKYE